MDPGFVERHIEDLPNLRKLRDRAGLTRLATTMPPQSPVAWATFLTGSDPDQHGIFDFVHREPSTAEPISAFGTITPPERTLRIGPWLLPLSSARIRNFRRGKTLQERLTETGIPVTMMRMPTNYPPVEGAGAALSGMGTPDLEGSLGTFTFYTDDPSVRDDQPGATGHVVHVSANDGRIALKVKGPPNTLRVDALAPELEIAMDVDSSAQAALVRAEDQRIVLRQGEWSPWIRVRFPLLPGGLSTVSGMFRLYLQQTTPRIRVYRSPLNIDPEDPVLPVSAPANYAREIAGRIGSFHTLGIDEDSSALRQGVFSLAEYEEQSRFVGREHTALLKDTLDRFQGGFLFFYFSEVDQDSHMMWGHHDDDLLRTYRKVDNDIGMVMARQPSAEIIVMSDHGFTSFDRAVSLNSWLLQEGLMSLKPVARSVASPTLENVDWHRTNAYAIGLNGLYINLSGREQDGLVQQSDYQSVVADLRRRLLDWRDPDSGRPVVADVSISARKGGKYEPDLIVGYAPGYRSSWLANGIEANSIQDNTDAWIGDHCMAASAVPGVLMGISGPQGLKDVNAFILRQFGVHN